MESKTTDQQIFSMPLKTFVPMMIFIILSTNTVSLTLQRLSNLETKEKYNVEAANRRLKHLKKELQNEYKINQLEKELKKCSSK